MIRNRSARRLGLALAVTALVVSGCGTRVERAPTGAGQSIGSSEPTAGPTGGISAASEALPATPESSPASTPSGTVAPSAASSKPTGPSAGASSAAASPKSAAAAAGQPAAAPNRGASPRPGASPAVGGGTQPAPGGGAAATPAPAGKKSPVVVASIGNYGGVAGPTMLPIIKGTQIWVQWINDRGGVNGHPVKLLVLDDGSDVARHRAQAQDAVERLGAVAFLSEGAPLSGTGTLDYLKQKQIPVVGTETGVSWSVEHPMYFPQSTSGLPMFESLIRGVAQQLLPTGKKSVGVVYCTETPMCDVHRKMWEKSAPEVGLKYVFSGQASLAQPDFTAICLSARNAGADALLFSMDGASIRRVAQACTRQGYRPLYASVAGILFDEFKSEDSLQTVVGTSPFYPYFKTDLPAIQEFAQAVARFGSPDLTGIGPLTGWTSGKLFERVTKALPEPPTSTAILDGLYTVKNDDLGGLAVPLTFTKGEDHATVPQCWWNLKVQNKAWASADNYQRNCR